MVDSDMPKLHLLRDDGTCEEMPVLEVDALFSTIRSRLNQYAIKSFTLTSLEGYCPVQGLGTVNGYAWYFRARWDGWTFEVNDKVILEGKYGTVNEAGWMPYQAALALIASGLHAYALTLAQPASDLGHGE